MEKEEMKRRESARGDVQEKEGKEGRAGKEGRR